MKRPPCSFDPMRAIAAAMFVLALAGCASFGPQTITRDRFDYVTAISDSLKSQMLLNLVKIRYMDPPVFMDVATVISSYALQNEVAIGGQFAPPGRGDTFGTANYTGTYADRPTITYQPLNGDKFARSLMAPIPIPGILYLIQSGYPADLVLRICVNTINGLENEVGAFASSRPGDPKFRELMTALREAQRAEGAGFRIRQRETPVVVMFTSKNAGAAATRRIRELLGLNPTELEFTIGYGAQAENDREIAVLTRSILQVTANFAAYIDVPARDVAERRVYGVERSAEQQQLFPPLLAVRNGAEAPPDAYVSIRYRGQSFWIDDRDLESKGTFAFLMLMFTLTEGAPAQPAPIVTVPAR